jgi:L-ascorbate metabolism protein UlaG (beta-lactamase superfamily)
MNKLLLVLIILGALVFGFYAFNSYIYNEKQGDPSNTTEPTDRDPSIITTNEPQDSPVEVIPITHATTILKWQNAVIYIDPTGNEEAFANQPDADIILVTDIHGDHLNEPTLKAVIKDSTFIAPQAVKDQLQPDLGERVQVLANDQTTTVLDFDITAVPMYNFPETVNSRHVNGRGNGYIIERDGYRVYIAGDTGPTPEMRALENINMAFVPMNEPFTMSVDEAAEAVLDFKPQTVYPYHYREQNGLADVNKFKDLVNVVDPSINVVLLNWYPE